MDTATATSRMNRPGRVRFRSKGRVRSQQHRLDGQGGGQDQRARPGRPGQSAWGVGRHGGGILHGLPAGPPLPRDGAGRGAGPPPESTRAGAARHRGVRRGAGGARSCASRSSGCGSRPPSCLRSADPPLGEAEGRTGAWRCAASGSGSCWRSTATCSSSLHLMIAGRLHWKEPGARPPGRVGLAAFDFPTGTLVLTEAGTQAARLAAPGARRGGAAGARSRRARAARGRPGLLLGARSAARTTPSSARSPIPRLFSGIGNAYSDEILHRARLSPVQLSRAARRRRDRAPVRGDPRRAAGVDGAAAPRGRGGLPREGDRLPRGHGRSRKVRQPCPVCGTAVQRIVRAENEANYCPRCQTGGQLLADRSLSRLLKEDWPRTIEELEKNPALGVRAQPAPGARAPGRASSRR